MFSDPQSYEGMINFLNPLWSAPEIDPNATFTVSLGIPVENK